jgi:hypothetical protein
LLSRNGSNERKSILGKSDVLKETGKYQGQSDGITENILYIILFVGIVVFFIYLIYKKQLRLQKELNHSSPLMKIFERASVSNQGSLLRKKVKPPEDRIRREIFDLEKYAHKIKLERHPFETLKEWWLRVGLTGFEELLDIYDNVRYGEFTYSIEDATQISKEIRQIRQKLKGIYKNNQEKNMKL